MICERPIKANGLVVGCDNCIPCRVNRRRVWSSRLQMEALGHERACFITLTYNDRFYPSDGSVRPDALKNFIKKLRRVMAKDERKIRFYAVGEYGDNTWRPHYHALLFGANSLDQSAIEKAWTDREGTSLGFVMVGELSRESAGYVAGYCTKKLTHPENPLLEGRHPEFARMSNRPGIGVPGLAKLVQALEPYQYEIESAGDVPYRVKLFGKEQPLGKYLHNKLREHFFSEEYIAKLKEEKKALYDAELCGLQMAEIRSNPKAGSYKTILRDLNLGRIHQIKSRHQRNIERKSL